MYYTWACKINLTEIILDGFILFVIFLNFFFFIFSTLFMFTYNHFPFPFVFFFYLPICLLRISFAYRVFILNLWKAFFTFQRRNNSIVFRVWYLRDILLYRQKTKRVRKLFSFLIFLWQWAFQQMAEKDNMLVCDNDCYELNVLTFAEGM